MTPAHLTSSLAETPTSRRDPYLATLTARGLDNTWGSRRKVGGERSEVGGERSDVGGEWMVGGEREGKGSA